MKTSTTAAQTLVVLEATGVYWLSFATFFSRQGYAGSRVNPTQAHYFARPCSSARKRMPSTTAQIADIETELATLLPTEEQEACEEGAPSLDRAWALTIARLQTIPGIGLLTALWLVVTTMNFSLCASAEQATAYAGLAPMPRESGTSVRKRSCIGHTGNGRLRTALYLAPPCRYPL